MNVKLDVIIQAIMKGDGFDKASKGAGKTGGALTKLSSMGAAAVAALAAATVAFVNDSLASFQAFETGMAEVFTLMPGMSEQAMGAMEADVLAFSAEAGRLPGEVMPALYQSISAGVPSSNVFDFMQIASDAALGGVTDLETAVDGITSVTNAYGSEVIDAATASDVMFTAVKLGKCLVGETRVLLSDGQYIRIDELQGENTVVSFDGRNFVPMMAGWVDQGVKPTVKLTTRLGREVTTTWNHPYLSTKKNESLRSTQQGQWRKVSELDVGDRIAVPTSLPYFGNKQIPQHKAGLLGLWLAEGSSSATTPRITTTTYQSQLENWATDWGLTIRNYEKREGFAPSYGLSSKSNNAFQAWLGQLELLGGSAGTKHIPADVFTWNRKSTATLLRWLFNGDGWLADLKQRSGFQLGFCSASEQLVRDVSHLLLRFGIVGRVRRRNNANAWVWETNRYAEIERFVDSIGIDRDSVPVFKQHKPQKQRRMWGVVEYDPIVSIEAGEPQHVYDLTVPDLHNFVANDIVAHNTDFEQLSKSLFNVIPTAASLGVGFEDVAAQLAALTAQGTPTSVATTQIRAAFVEASKSGTKLDLALRDLTGKGFADLVASGQSSTDIFLNLRNSMPEQEFRDLFSSVEASNAVLGVTSQTGLDIIEAFGGVEGTLGATAAAAETMAGTMGHLEAQADAATEAYKITMGESVSPLKEAYLELKTGVLTYLTAEQAVINAERAGNITSEQRRDIVTELSKGNITAAQATAILAAQTAVLSDETIALAESTSSSDRLMLQHAGTMESMSDSTDSADQTLSNYVETVGMTTDEIIDYSANAAAAAGINQDLGDKTAMLSNHLTDEEAAAAAASVAAAKLREEEKQLAEASAIAAQAATELAARTGETFVSALNASGSIGFYNESLDQLGEKTYFVSDATGEQQVALGDLQGEYDKLSEQLVSYQMGLDSVGLSEDERNAKVAETQAAMGEIQAAIDPLIAVGGEWVTTNQEATVNQDAVNQALFDNVAASGASAQELAILGGALGLYSEEAVAAALKTALIEEKISQVTAAWDGTAEGAAAMQVEIGGFIEKLGEMDSMQADTAAASEDLTAKIAANQDAATNAAGAQDALAIEMGNTGTAATDAGTEVDTLADSVKDVPKDLEIKYTDPGYQTVLDDAQRLIQVLQQLQNSTAQGPPSGGNVPPTNSPGSGGYAEGGILGGYTSATDAMTFRGTKGEGVLQLSAMDRIGSDAFHDLNEGNLAGFASKMGLGGGGVTIQEGAIQVIAMPHQNPHEIAASVITALQQQTG